MKKYILLAAFAALTLASCENVETPGPVPSLKGFLILNNGNMGSNDASIALYNPDTKEVAGDLFFKVNGRRLGLRIVEVRKPVNGILADILKHFH